MSTATHTVNLAGLEAELRGLGVDPATADWSPTLGIISVFLGASFKRCFVESKTPDGRPWPPFKRTPSRRRGGRSAKLLIDRGLLMASASAAGARGSVREITRHTLEQGSNLDYSGFQNDGTRTIPARQFVGISDAMGRRIEELVADDVVRRMGFA